jgi:hypothetical protein
MQRLKRAAREPTTLVAVATALYYLFHLCSHGNSDRVSILILACAVVVIGIMCKDRTNQ